ncbi:hypothetical protein [Thermomonas flagellata]|uniref:hypothetical protein n=1 Tax=Thermomonas flagellata TaxID=2888524 RepID=UPI001F0433FC|nr:hypothetical protein [Thermomonas flagellata]
MAALRILAAGVFGACAGAVAGFFLALAGGEWLFGWHDTIGPELRVAFFGALIGAALMAIWQPSRNARRHARSAADRSKT